MDGQHRRRRNARGTAFGDRPRSLRRAPMTSTRATTLRARASPPTRRSRFRARSTSPWERSALPRSRDSRAQTRSRSWAWLDRSDQCDPEQPGARPASRRRTDRAARRQPRQTPRHSPTSRRPPTRPRRFSARPSQKPAAQATRRSAFAALAAIVFPAGDAGAGSLTYSTDVIADADVTVVPRNHRLPRPARCAMESSPST